MLFVSDPARYFATGYWYNNCFPYHVAGFYYKRKAQNMQGQAMKCMIFQTHSKSVFVFLLHSPPLLFRSHRVSGRFPDNDTSLSLPPAPAVRLSCSWNLPLPASAESSSAVSESVTSPLLFVLRYPGYICAILFPSSSTLSAEVWIGPVYLFLLFFQKKAATDQPLFVSILTK